MCFSQPKAPDVAPAPAPAEAPPQEQQIGAKRKAEDLASFGAGGASTRVDRTITAPSGGTGLKM